MVGSWPHGAQGIQRPCPKTNILGGGEPFSKGVSSRELQQRHLQTGRTIQYDVSMLCPPQPSQKLYPTTMANCP